MTKAEADAVIAEIVSGAEAIEVSISLLERRLADALAINVEGDVPPPFGLLRVVETLGLGPPHPDGISPLVLVEALIADLPSARTDTVAAQAAHRTSVSWEQKFETLASWFEAGEAEEKLLQPPKDAQTADRGCLGPAASHKTEILGRTLRLDGSNLEGGCRRRG